MCTCFHGRAVQLVEGSSGVKEMYAIDVFSIDAMVFLLCI